MRARDFPSYRLRHAIRVWRYERRHPWQFSDGKGKRAGHHGHVVRLPESDLDRRLHQ